MSAESDKKGASKDALPVEQAVLRLKADIRSGRLTPGQRLIEPDLVRDLGFSRGTIREALRVLSGEGLIEIIRWKGARVRRLSSEEMADLGRVFSALLNIAMAMAIEKLGASTARDELERAYQGLLRSLEQKRALAVFEALDEYRETIFRIADSRYLTIFAERGEIQIYQAQVELDLRQRDTLDWNAIGQHFERVHSLMMSGDLGRLTSLVQQRMRSLISELFAQ